MNLLRRAFRILVPVGWAEVDSDSGSAFRYIQVWRTAVILNVTFCVLPLVVMTLVNYSQYRRVLRDEMTQPIYHLASNTKRTIESYLDERRAALDFIVLQRTFGELSSQDFLESLFRDLRLAHGNLVDIGLIDSTGEQVSYAGPYQLIGKNYADQDWFHEVRLRGVHVSDMFTGFRNLPHFVIAVKHEREDEGFFILRTTISMEMLYQHIRSLSLNPSTDAFLISQDGILQTPSRSHGSPLEPCPLPQPTFSEVTTVREVRGSDGTPHILAYSYIRNSPFVLMVVADSSEVNQSWFVLRRELVAFLLVSSIIIILLIAATATYLISHIREADLQRAALYHKMEYTNKMATIGRLSAGVAHEVNNPLAIINEKAGLASDIISFSDDFPHKDRLLSFMKSIIQSVDRCATITHRLLGFAKQVDVQHGSVYLDQLIREVLTFLDKEARYRNVTVEVKSTDNLPPIVSDHAQLQQVFLNIINNAFAAVDEGGRVRIDLRPETHKAVTVRIADNGSGITQEHLEHIFEPFFSTKGNYGTGLGLSITYGIVTKLGGRIRVESEPGKETCFTVTLPVERDQNEH